MAPGAAKRVAERSGADAVQMSVQQNVQKSNISIASRDDESSENQVLVRRTINNQFVGNRNFFLENNAWVDAEYKSDTKLSEVRVQFASEEYFDLIEKNRELAQYFAMGEEVVVIWKDRIYRVTR